MRGLGKGVHSFRKGMQDAKKEMEMPIEDDEKDEKPKDKDKA